MDADFPQTLGNAVLLDGIENPLCRIICPAGIDFSGRSRKFINESATLVLFANSGNFQGVLRVPVIESSSPNKMRLPLRAPK
jgi:hypothetical protein